MAGVAFPQGLPTGAEDDAPSPAIPDPSRLVATPRPTGCLRRGRAGPGGLPPDAAAHESGGDGREGAVHRLLPVGYGRGVPRRLLARVAGHVPQRRGGELLLPRPTILL